MDTRDEVVLALTDDLNSSISDPHSQSTRRTALIGHYAFRLSAFLVYLFCTWFTSSFITAFILVLILLSLDFWFTKNISGRILVGLRWSSQTDSNTGKVNWRFDSHKPSVIDTADPSSLTRRELVIRADRLKFNRLFWVGLIGSSVFWFLFVLGAIFSFNLRWALVSIIGLGMSLVNLYGYVLCRMSNMNESTMNVFNWAKNAAKTNFIDQIWFLNKSKTPSTFQNEIPITA